MRAEQAMKTLILFVVAALLLSLRCAMSQSEGELVLVQVIHRYAVLQALSGRLGNVRLTRSDSEVLNYFGLLGASFARTTALATAFVQARREGAANDGSVPCTSLGTSLRV